MQIRVCSDCKSRNIEPYGITKPEGFKVFKCNDCGHLGTILIEEDK